MSYKPVMKTIGSKLRGLFSTTGQTVETALPNEIEVSPSGSESSGLSVLTLYTDPQAQEESFNLYKNIECTEGYSSVEEGNEALLAAASIRVVMVHEGDILGMVFPWDARPANVTMGLLLPMVRLNAEEEVPLYIESSESEAPQVEIHN